MMHGTINIKYMRYVTMQRFKRRNKILETYMLTIGNLFVCSGTAVTRQFVPALCTLLYPLGTLTWRIPLFNFHRGHHLYKWAACEIDFFPASSADVKDDACGLLRHTYSCHFYRIYIQKRKNPLRQVVEGTELCTLVNDQLDAQFLYFIIRLLQSSTCFEHRRAHHQEDKLY